MASYLTFLIASFLLYFFKYLHPFRMQQQFDDACWCYISLFYLHICKLNFVSGNLTLSTSLWKQCVLPFEIICFLRKNPGWLSLPCTCLISINISQSKEQWKNHTIFSLDRHQHCLWLIVILSNNLQLANMSQMYCCYSFFSKVFFDWLHMFHKNRHWFKVRLCFPWGQFPVTITAGRVLAKCVCSCNCEHFPWRQKQ